MADAKVYLERSYWPIIRELQELGIDFTTDEDEKDECRFFVYVINHPKEYMGETVFTYEEETLPLDLAYHAAMFAEIAHVSTQMPRSTFVFVTEQGEMFYEAAVALFRALGTNVFGDSELVREVTRLNKMVEFTRAITEEEFEIDQDL